MSLLNVRLYAVCMYVCAADVDGGGVSYTNLFVLYFLLCLFCIKIIAKKSNKNKKRKKLT